MEKAIQRPQRKSRVQKGAPGPLRSCKKKTIKKGTGNRDERGMKEKKKARKSSILKGAKEQNLRNARQFPALERGEKPGFWRHRLKKKRAGGGGVGGVWRQVYKKQKREKIKNRKNAGPRRYGDEFHGS